MLVLEDVHWADDATLDAITVLGRRIGSLPALLVLTFRGGEAPPGHPLHATVGAIRADDAVILELAPLSASAVASLAGRRRGRGLRRRREGTRSTSPSCSPRGPPPSLPPSVANAVLGRASRLDDAEPAAGGARLGRPDPRRARRVLDAVMPDWPAAAVEPERRRAARGRPALRPLPARAGSQRDQVEHSRSPSGGASTARSSRRCSQPTPIRPTSSTTPRPRARRTSSPTYALVAARRAAALDSNREAYSHYRRASDFARPAVRRPSRRQLLEELATRGVRRRPARRRLRRDRARDRGSTASSATTRPSAAARGSCRGSTGSRATATPRGRRRARRSRSSSRSASRSSWRRAYSGLVPARDARRGPRPGASHGATSALELATRLGDERTRAHALINIGSAQAAARPNGDRARCSRRTRSRTPPATGTRRRARSSTSPTR